MFGLSFRIIFPPFVADHPLVTQLVAVFFLFIYIHIVDGANDTADMMNTISHVLKGKQCVQEKTSDV